MTSKYYTLQYSQQNIYKEIQSKIESFSTEFIFQNTSFDTVRDVFKAVLEDHPEYFWLSGASSGTEKTIGSFSTIYFRPEITDKETIAQVKNNKIRFDSKVSELISLAKMHSSDVYEQILFLHDYLVMSVDYQINASHCYDAYGCLVLERAVCAGYAAAFQVLMNKLGVECGRVRGCSTSALTGEVSHVWNYIKLSDGYYFIDVTWDDPVLNGGTFRDNMSHSYFCLDLQEIQLTHRISSDQFIPLSYGKKYNYYRYRGWHVDAYSFNAVRDIAEKQLRSGKQFSVKFGSRIQLNSAIHDLIDNQRIFSISGLSNQISYIISESGLILEVIQK